LLPLKKQVNYKKYKPVITISIRGEILVGVVRAYYHLRQLLGKDKWHSVVPNHHEDPLKMTFEEKRYLGHKYYYRAMILPEKASGLDDYFRSQNLQFTIPEGFIPNKTITLSAGGDLIPYTCIQPAVCTSIWKHTGDFFFNADIVFANLETPADFSKPVSAAPEVMLHDMYFNADAAIMKIFNGHDQYKGYDVLSVVNNHSLDMGTEGLMNTMQLLRQKNIAYCGAALNKEEQNDFPIIERNGIKTAFLAATFSFNKEVLPNDKKWLCNHIELNQPDPDITLLIEQAALARERGADIIVAALHAGCAYQAYPGLQVVKNIHHICDAAGIDIVIAGHPHNAQPMEIYHSAVTGKQHFIAYSLNDLIAYDIFKWCHLPMMLKIEISKGMLNEKPFTCVTALQVKAAYMHAAIKNGKVTSLELLDYKQVKTEPSKYFTNKNDRQKFEETSDFFERFVLLPQQQHVLV
jgi:poly-gamma-glutamate capsule biosynthesis protein CapA/YwtB (metallophosphatase superfamily)